MAASNQFTVPVGTRHSFGIELECLIAYLPQGMEDPHQSEADKLPPLTRTESHDYGLIEILAAVRATLEKHGIPVKDPSPLAKSPPGVPVRLRGIDKWDVGMDSSVSEISRNDHRWQAIEIRSPALWATEESFEEIKYVVNVLTSNHRILINSTCGFHVHVGNGIQFFPGGALKRLGSFLWAADPILSRLHAPYRRINRYSRSIRHQSRLAFPKDVRPNIPHTRHDPIATTTFSDTSQEEKEHGGMKEWKEYVRWRNQVGPFMTLGMDVDDIRGGGGPVAREGSEKNSADSGHSPASSLLIERPEEDPTEHLRGEKIEEPEVNPSENMHKSTPLHLPPFHILKRELHRWREEAMKLDLPPDEHTMDRNIGWVRFDRVRDPRVNEWVRARCYDRHKHTHVHHLSTEEQVDLMLQAQCVVLFMHLDYRNLPQQDTYDLLVACAPFIESARSIWIWNTTTEQWEFHWFSIEDKLIHTRADREINIDAPHVVYRFENLAKLTELEGSHTEQGIEYINRADYDEALNTNKGVEQLVNGLHEYADSPGPRYMDDLPPGYGNSGYGKADNPNPGYKIYSTPTSDEGSPSEKPHYLTSSSSSSGKDFMPGAWSAMEDAFAKNPAPDPSTRTPPPRAPKLKPHDIESLPEPYIKEIYKESNAIVEEDWGLIGWLPPSTYPIPDEDEPVIPATTTTPMGLAELALCKSAAEVGTLLSAVNDTWRLNYNFRNYKTTWLGDNIDEEDSQELMTTTVPAELVNDEYNPRTIEFREAGGSMSPQRIATWARICAGIVRWSRRSSVADFLEVIQKLADQEERDRRWWEAKQAGGEAWDAYVEVFEDSDNMERYDVCDLLEDIGLFVEAAIVRKLESENGPPR
ncbi:putative amidoligase enzyme-domain-containing protein [Hypoxylon crocopeplum]|nr:putative amidoligase enzyme-domain-containing protein [Hypoxylon crocopeplum]